MSTMGFGVRYYLPKTEFAVTVTERDTVVVAEGGSRVRRVVDVTVAPASVADHDVAYVVDLHEGLLEKLSLALEFDDRQVITSINSEAGRDLAVVTSALGKVLGALTPLKLKGFDRLRSPKPGEAPSLEEQWEAQHETLAATSVALQARLVTLLADLSDPQTEPTRIVRLGAAIDVLQSHLASIGQVRRAWIAAHAKTVATMTSTLQVADALQLSTSVLPETLPPEVVEGLAAADVTAHGAARLGLVHDGVVLALADPSRPEGDGGQGEDGAGGAVTERRLTDALAVRMPRPVTLGIYTRDEQCWTLDHDSVLDLDVVDGLAPAVEMSLDGSWWRDRKVALAYHPDMSLKSFAVTSASSLSAPLGDVAGLVEAAIKARAEAAKKPSPQAQQLAANKLTLDLLNTATEIEVLSATRARAAELAVMEQEQKVRAARS